MRIDHTVIQALCHCITCRKVSGSSNTVNFAIPDGNFILQKGTPTKFAKEHESGMTLTIYFCPQCGSTIYKEGSADMFKGLKLVQAGTLHDNTLLSSGIAAELYVSERANWLVNVNGAAEMATFTNDAKSSL
jgi:hypothetical protein